MKKGTTNLRSGVKGTSYSAPLIKESLQKQQDLVKKSSKKPLAFLRKYVGVRGRISQAEFCKYTYLSKPTVKRYVSSTKSLIDESRTRVAYGLMLFWNALEHYAYEDLVEELEGKEYNQKIDHLPTEDEMKRMAKKRLLAEYHSAFHEDAEIAWILSENPSDLARILYNYRYHRISSKGKRDNS